MLKDNYKLLSYPLNEKIPVYGKKYSFQIKEERQIKKNDTCNTFMLSFLNHSGTHIDAPRHFFTRGKPIAKFNIKELIFSRPFILNLSKNSDELITEKDLRRIKKCDLLLIKTGFYKFRRSDRYIFHNPGFSAQAADFIRKEYPYIQAIGIDTISISSYQNRPEGRQAHRILLTNNVYPGKPLLLIEDMDLSVCTLPLKKVFVAPLFIEKVDSAPCTVIAEFYPVNKKGVKR